AFEGWDPDRIARYGERDVERLLGDAGIVRNRLKITATINNAQTVLRLREEFGGLGPYLWSWVGGVPIVNTWATSAEVPARTELSDALSKDLAQRGFKFVGSTIVYSYLQAIGMVDDHLTTCFRHGDREVRKAEVGHRS
ncbi:MAG: DNA-3-methyladenine glycosylase I, partial [Burkholderiaceae bacterium]